MDTRCGYIAILGAPNAGKSTLLNQLVGSKISIVSPKVQTTRFRVRGICMEGQAQLIFVDTPGIFQGKGAFEKSMVEEAWAGLADADAVLVLVDALKGLSEDTLHILDRLEKRLPKKKLPACIALNKIDAVEKPELITLAQACAKYSAFEQIFMISALKNDGVRDLRAWLARHMPEGQFLYPEDQLSDLPLRLLAAEITREKLFYQLRHELPYSLTVETEAWEHRKSGTVAISQAILVQRESQKMIILGKGGQMLKKIGTSARIELEKQLDAKVLLKLFVKVDADWQGRGPAPVL